MFPAKEPDARSAASGSGSGWGHIPRDQWGGQSIGGSSVKSAAPGSSSGWGHISHDQWGGESIGGSSVKPASPVKSSAQKVKKSWADQMDEADNKSVASTISGWGQVSNGPWG